MRERGEAAGREVHSPPVPDVQFLNTFQLPGTMRTAIPFNLCKTDRQTYTYMYVHQPPSNQQQQQTYNVHTYMCVCVTRKDIITINLFETSFLILSLQEHLRKTILLSTLRSLQTYFNKY